MEPAGRVTRSLRRRLNSIDVEVSGKSTPTLELETVREEMVLTPSKRVGKRILNNERNSETPERTPLGRTTRRRSVTEVTASPALLATPTRKTRRNSISNMDSVNEKLGSVKKNMRKSIITDVVEELNENGDNISPKSCTSISPKKTLVVKLSKLKQIEKSPEDTPKKGSPKAKNELHSPGRNKTSPLTINLRDRNKLSPVSNNSPKSVQEKQSPFGSNKRASLNNSVEVNTDIEMDDCLQVAEKTPKKTAGRKSKSESSDSNKSTRKSLNGLETDVINISGVSEDCYSTDVQSNSSIKSAGKKKKNEAETSYKKIKSSSLMANNDIDENDERNINVSTQNKSDLKDSPRKFKNGFQEENKNGNVNESKSKCNKRISFNSTSMKEVSLDSNLKSDQMELDYKNKNLNEREDSHNFSSSLCSDKEMATSHNSESHDNNETESKLKSVTFNEAESIPEKESSRYPKTPIASKKKESNCLRESDEDDQLESPTKLMKENDEAENESPNKLSSVKKTVTYTLRNENFVEKDMLNKIVEKKMFASSTPFNTPKDKKTSVKQKSLVPFPKSDLQSNANNEEPKFSKSWTQSVRRSANEKIDKFSMSVQEPKVTSNVPFLKRNFKKKYISAEDSESEEEEIKNEEKYGNEFIENEAEDCGSEEDSMDEEERQYLKDNEIVERGISIGSEDTDQSEHESDGDDSFIVSDDEISEFEEQTSNSSAEISKKKNFKRIQKNDSDSEKSNPDELHQSLSSANSSSKKILRIKDETSNDESDSNDVCEVPETQQLNESNSSMKVKNKSHNTTVTETDSNSHQAKNMSLNASKTKKLNGSKKGTLDIEVSRFIDQTSSDEDESTKASPSREKRSENESSMKIVFEESDSDAPNANDEKSKNKSIFNTSLKNTQKCSPMSKRNSNAFQNVDSLPDYGEKEENDFQHAEDKAIATTSVSDNENGDSDENNVFEEDAASDQGASKHSSNRIEENENISEKENQEDLNVSSDLVEEEHSKMKISLSISEDYNENEDEDFVPNDEGEESSEDNSEYSSDVSEKNCPNQGASQHNSNQIGENENISEKEKQNDSNVSSDLVEEEHSVVKFDKMKISLSIPEDYNENEDEDFVPNDESQESSEDDSEYSSDVSEKNYPVSLSFTSKNEYQTGKPKSQTMHSSYTDGIGLKGKRSKQIVDSDKTDIVITLSKRNKSCIEVRGVENMNPNENVKHKDNSRDAGETEATRANGSNQAENEPLVLNHEFDAEQEKSTSQHNNHLVSDDPTSPASNKKHEKTEVTDSIANKGSKESNSTSTTDAVNENSSNKTRDISYILKCCNDILSAANEAKLKNKQRMREEGLKNKKKFKVQVENKDVVKINNVIEAGRIEKVKNKKALSQAIRHAETILVKNPKIKVAHEKDNKQLPQEILEAISSDKKETKKNENITSSQIRSDPMEKLNKSNKKLKKSEKHKLSNSSEDENPTKIQKTNSLVSTSSGLFVEEPVTPKRRKVSKIELPTGTVYEEPITPIKSNRSNGFIESPITPIGFKVRNILTAGQKEIPELKSNKKSKRKLIAEPVNVLPTLIWTTSGQFVEEVYNPVKANKKSSAATDFYAVPLKSKNNQSKQYGYGIVNKKAIEFKRQALTASNSCRISSKDLLIRKEKQKFNSK